MTTDRRVSIPAASPWSARFELRSLALAAPSWIAAPAFAALILGGAWLDASWTVAVYALSFWHYYLYWLAYYFGAVSPGEFKRDAVVWKTVALVALACVYFAVPPSADIIAPRRDYARKRAHRPGASGNRQFTLSRLF